MEKRSEVVLVTEAASGIGNACATYLAKKGYSTYAACRDAASYERKADEFFELLPMDHLDDASVAKAADSLLAKEGRIDHLVCCPGAGLLGSVEDCSVAEARRQLESDYIGTLRVIKAFLPSMREAGSGRIVVTTSLAAFAGLPFLSHYSASKRGLEALVDALRQELAPFAVQACALELGPLGSSFPGTVGISDRDRGPGPYEDAFKRILAIREPEAVAARLPLAAAKTIHGLLLARSMPARRAVGPLWLRAAALGRRLLALSNSERVVRRYISRK